MSLADLPLPSGVRLIADALFETVLRGVLALRPRGGPANAPAAETLPLLRRLARILRYAFLICAAWIETPPSRPRAPDARAQQPRGFRPRRACFRLFTPFRARAGEEGPKKPPPPALARAARDPVLTAQRRRDALVDALQDPLRYVRRLARSLARDIVVIAWRPPKRPPPTHRRQYWDDLMEGWREAWFQLGEWRRRRRDIAQGAPA